MLCLESRAGTGVAVAIALRAAATPAARLRTAIVEGATAGIDGMKRGGHSDKRFVKCYNAGKERGTLAFILVLS